MTDKKIGYLSFPLKPGKEFDHGFLYGHIQCRGRFITNDDFRFQYQSSCDGDTLPLSA